jgi:hypothetical protein
MTEVAGYLLYDTSESIGTAIVVYGMASKK